MPNPPDAATKAALQAQYKNSEEALTKSLGAAQSPLGQETGNVARPIAPTWWTTENAMTVSTVVLAVGLAVVLIASFLIREGRDGQLVLKVCATLLIITFAVFLIVAGWSDQQIAPAMGLLGTIAGYLLGKESTPKQNTPQKDD